MRAEVGTAALVAIALTSWGCNDGKSPLAPVEVPRPAARSDHAFYGGVYLGDAESTPGGVAAAILDYTRLVGSKPALVKTFHHLGADLSPSGWAGRVVHQIAQAGATNYIAIDLDWPGRTSGSLLEAINAGAADALLARAARAVAQLPGTVLVEPGWEMNGNSNYGWQGVANGNGRNAPVQYAAAWRRLVQAFRANGATNVRWVFNPNVGNALGGPAAGDGHWNWYGHYYPGDAYVDYIGAHGYNGSVTWSTSYKDFDTLFDSAAADHMLSDMARRYPNKPIIIGEVAAEETPGRDKGEWVAKAYTRMQSDPRVAGAIWFNMNKEADWRVNSSARSLAAYRSAMRGAGVREIFQDVTVRPLVMAGR